MTGSRGPEEVAGALEGKSEWLSSSRRLVGERDRRRCVGGDKERSRGMGERDLGG